MGLIYCSECGKQISDKAKACPNCGAPRQYSQWNSLLPDEKLSITKSLVYTIICMSLMLILAFAPTWFGLLGLYSETDYSSDFLLQHMLQNPNYLHNEILKMALGLSVWVALLYFFIMKTYVKSALVVQKPVKYKIGLVRNIVFIVIGIIGSIHFVKGFFAGIKLIHAWNELMADNFVKSLYGLAETAIPALKEMKWFYVEVIVLNALSFLIFVGITIVEVIGVLECFIKFYAPKELTNDREEVFPYAEMEEKKL